MIQYMTGCNRYIACVTIPVSNDLPRKGKIMIESTIIRGTNKKPAASQALDHFFEGNPGSR